MVQQTDDLRRDMEMRRIAISETVDQIQNRVTPSHVAARGRYRVRARMGRWKDKLMGQVQEHDGGGVKERAEEMKGRAEGMKGRAGDMTDSMRQAPSAVERYTRGNPLAVGLIAVGAGALIASMLPETRQEREMAQRIQPQMQEAASGVADTGRDMAEDLKDTAKEGASRVQESAKSAGQDIKEETRGAGERVGGGGA